MYVCVFIIVCACVVSQERTPSEDSLECHPVSRGLLCTVKNISKLMSIPGPSCLCLPSHRVAERSQVWLLPCAAFTLVLEMQA